MTPVRHARHVEASHDPRDLVREAAAPVLGDIPWGYGHDRVTAMARDPHWMFVYWELTDEAIEQARTAVGASEAPCVLRVYDTTYRLFDGTNANWSMDVDVHRPATTTTCASIAPQPPYTSRSGCGVSTGASPRSRARAPWRCRGIPSRPTRPRPG